MIHGDVSRANIVYDDRRFGLIDFGDAGAGPRVADIAIALAQLAITSGKLRPEIWSGLWSGYAAIANPSDAERAAVLPLVKLRYAQLIVDHVWRELSGGITRATWRWSRWGSRDCTRSRRRRRRCSPWMRVVMRGAA